MTAGESKKDKKRKKRKGLVGMSLAQISSGLVSDRGFSSLLMKMFHSHLMPPSLMNSIEEKRETNSEGKKFSFCQIGEARREDDP